MLHFSQPLDNRRVLEIVRRVCAHVDVRLIDHGLRVAWLLARLLELQGERYTKSQRRDLCMLAALHDVGAYKTEEIDRLVQFETGPVWAHAIYGSLFLKYFSPFRALSDAVLYHHADYALLESLPIDPAHKEIAQLLMVADRADVLLHYEGFSREALFAQLDALAGTRYSPEVLALLHQVERLSPTAEELERDTLLYGTLCTPAFTLEEIDALFKMLVCIIDFRSRHTVTHTVTTASVSKSIAKLLGMEADAVSAVVNGALLHDLGKVGIPVEILEFPGRLSPQAMTVMRTHVDLTEEILGDCVYEPARQVALRHHEKLDGSGYPRGLTGAELTLPERVVAVADIVSALCGTRSYKEAFPKEKVLTIITEMSREGLIDSDIVALIVLHFDDIVANVRRRTAPLLDIYNTIATEYDFLLHTYVK